MENIMTETAQQDDKGLKILKTVVLSMGALLIVGTVALFIAIIIKANSSDSKPVAAKKIPDTQCTQKEYQAPIIGKVVSTDIEGNTLTIVTTKQIILYDICHGKTLATFNSLDR